jgi:hypothetical protein
VRLDNSSRAHAASTFGVEAETAHTPTWPWLTHWVRRGSLGGANEPRAERRDDSGREEVEVVCAGPPSAEYDELVGEDTGQGVARPSPLG